MSAEIQYSKRQFSRREVIGFARDAAIVAAAALLYGCDEAKTGSISNIPQSPENANPVSCKADLHGDVNVRSSPGLAGIVRAGNDNNPIVRVEILDVVKGQYIEALGSHADLEIVHKGTETSLQTAWVKIKLPDGRLGYVTAKYIQAECPPLLSTRKKTP